MVVWAFRGGGSVVGAWWWGLGGGFSVVGFRWWGFHGGGLVEMVCKCLMSWKTFMQDGTQKSQTAAYKTDKLDVFG